MIHNIELSNQPCFAPSQCLENLGAVNFIAGPNSSGKTTLSRHLDATIASDDKATSGPSTLETMAFNTDFVSKNFLESDVLKGIFTLGENNVETLSRIASLKEEIQHLEAQADQISSQLLDPSGKKGVEKELRDLEDQLANKLWSMKTTYAKAFKKALSGSIKSKETFKNKVLEEAASQVDQAQPLKVLEEKARVLFEDKPVALPLIETINTSTLLMLESSPLLGQKILGKEDAALSELINQLGNTDWVRQGEMFLQKSQGICPFCQQSTPPSFAETLSAYFDETYSNQCRQIDHLVNAYKNETEIFVATVRRLVEKDTPYFNLDQVSDCLQLIRSHFQTNLLKLDIKQKEPANPITLESTASYIDQVLDNIAQANRKIAAHNDFVANVKKEKSSLIKEVWCFIAAEAKPDLKPYFDQKRELLSRISDLTEARTALQKEQTSLKDKIRQLERETTSIQPTIDDINGKLKAIGFERFMIVKEDSGPFYRIVRPDGKDAKDTLSEGERSLLSFLYFHHLLKGSQTKTDTMGDRLVVIDDPVSGLDEPRLQAVAQLVVELLEHVAPDGGPLKQMFILSHDARFLKAVTTRLDLTKVAFKDPTYWCLEPSPDGLTTVKRKASADELQF